MSEQEEEEEEEERKRGEATKYLSFLLRVSPSGLESSERGCCCEGGREGGGQWRVELPYQLCRPLTERRKKGRMRGREREGGP